MFTLEECIEALENVVDKTFIYSGNEVKTHFNNHNEAISHISEARRALRIMRSK